MLKSGNHILFGICPGSRPNGYPHYKSIKCFYNNRTSIGICPGRRPNGHPCYKSIKYFYNNCKRVVAVSVLSIGLLLGGCSSQKETEHIKAAFEAVTALEYEKAIELFVKAGEEGEKPAVIARGMGISYLGMARYNEAVEQFITALSYSDEFLDEFDFDTNYYLATAYYKNGQVEEAKNVYSAILSLRDDREAHFLRGMTFLEAGEVDKAKQDFDIALERNRTDYDMRINIYQAFSDKGMKEEGKLYLQAALGNTERKISDYDRGRLCYYMEDYETARNYLEAAKGSKDAEVVLLLGQTYEKLGDFNYAASVYSNFLSDNPDNVTILNRLGMCKLQAREAAEAIKYFEKALSLEDSTMMQILKFNQIVAYEYLGEFEQANLLMKDYLAVYPDDQDALREYEFLKSR